PLAGAGYAGRQTLPPDALWLRAMGGVALHAIGLSHPPRALPNGDHRRPAALAPPPPEAPPVIVVFGESTRRDLACAAGGPPCEQEVELDRAAPARIQYARASSIASSTEVASVSLWTGLPATSLAGEIATAPLLFDFAHARGYRTAYLSSQNLAFQRFDAF